MENTEVTTAASELLETAEVTEVVETAEVSVNPMNFVSNLYYMGVGMLGILVVMAIIIAATALLNRLFRDKSDKKTDDAQ